MNITSLISEYINGKSLSQIYREIKIEGFMGSISSFHYHYNYLSKRKQKEPKQIKSKPVDNREPLVLIKQYLLLLLKALKDIG